MRPAADWCIGTECIRTHFRIWPYYSTTAVQRVSGHGYRLTDSPPTLDTAVGCSAGKSAGVVLSRCGDCCRPDSPSPCVIRRGRRYATHEGRFAGVVGDKPTTDPAGGGEIGGGHVEVGGGRN